MNVSGDSLGQPVQPMAAAELETHLCLARTKTLLPISKKLVDNVNFQQFYETSTVMGSLLGIWRGMECFIVFLFFEKEEKGGFSKNNWSKWRMLSSLLIFVIAIHTTCLAWESVCFCSASHLCNKAWKLVFASWYAQVHWFSTTEADGVTLEWGQSQTPWRSHNALEITHIKMQRNNRSTRH